MEQGPAPLRQRKIGILAGYAKVSTSQKSSVRNARPLKLTDSSEAGVKIPVLQMKSCSRFVTEELPTLFHNSKLYIMIMDPLYHGVRPHDIRQSLPKVATSPSFLYSHLLLSITRPPYYSPRTLFVDPPLAVEPSKVQDLFRQPTYRRQHPLAA